MMTITDAEGAGMMAGIKTPQQYREIPEDRRLAFHFWASRQPLDDSVGAEMLAHPEGDWTVGQKFQLKTWMLRQPDGQRLHEGWIKDRMRLAAGVKP